MSRRTDPEVSSPDPPLSASAGLVAVARTERGGWVETVHFGAAAVVAPGGELIAALGDPEYRTFARSAAKPWQILPLLAAGGDEHFGLELADIALGCASHGGLPAHAARAAAMLERGGLEVADLLCGAHPPLDREAAERLAAERREPSPLHNNCSGKHAAMLLACRLLGWPTADYIEPGHPLQRRILETVARLCGVAEAEIGVGVDGCSVPAFHLPLAAVARGYAALADPASAPGSEQWAPAAGRAIEAMAAAPDMVAGPGRFTTRLIEATGGRIVGKEGASGFYALAVRGPVALGIALKVADGSDTVRDGVVVDLLRQLGCLSSDEVAALAAFRQPPLVNHRKLTVGRALPEHFEVREAAGGPKA